MVRTLRFAGNVALWLVAALGLLSGLVWAANQAGLIKPLVVISGSMEPGIMTGDLLVARPVPTAQVQVGEVASIYSDVTGDLVSHRVVSVERRADDRWAIQMKGDANDTPDAGTYVVGDRVWQPTWQVSGGGYVISTLTRPSVAIPLGVALAALLGLSLLPRDTVRPAPRRGLQVARTPGR
ncbi:signal peptidase I [Cellulomonas telluris]|uniref:signal peptidase I n=1 Tax=Cellulomonas telluris TaxID=2306636 RepID=UPI001FE6233F|nr:signal peptidase I [Cellulomonas telluris]